MRGWLLPKGLNQKKQREEKAEFVRSSGFSGRSVRLRTGLDVGSAARTPPESVCSRRGRACTSVRTGLSAG